MLTNITPSAINRREQENYYVDQNRCTNRCKRFSVQFIISPILRNDLVELRMLEQIIYALSSTIIIKNNINIYIMFVLFSYRNKMFL